MDFFEAVKARRSIRKFTEKPVPAEVIEKSLDAALLAPNSSNLQTWGFYWVKNPDLKKQLVEICLSQSAARTASELIVVTAELKLWKKTAPAMASFIGTLPNPPKMVKTYYEKLVPFTYGMYALAPLKWVLFRLVSLFRPMTVRPSTLRDLQEVSIKSAALASENLMLSIAAQGYATCPMEGFDERRLKRLLKLSCIDRVVMVIAVGEAAENGTWGPQFRAPRDWFVHEL